MKFSIITINYNHAEGLERTIKSVISQTCKDYEYIVIDGGSTDGSKDVILKYQEYISYWVSEPDGGIFPAMNKGTKVAQGDYCIYMNSGDTFYRDDILQKVVELKYIEDILTGDIYYGDHVCPTVDNVTMKTFYQSTLYHQGSFIKTELIKKLGYDENTRGVSDWKFFMQALVFNNATYHRLPFVVANFEAGGFTEKCRDISKQEVEAELKKCLPQRILIDYEDYCFGLSPYKKMMNSVEIIPPLKKIIYFIDVVILKILNIKLRLDWIKKLEL
ncbi:MAG: glycosyltransferase family 2 protein [Prevotella sp.]